MSAFGVCFVGKTCAITADAFAQVDPTHWLLDVTTAVSPHQNDLREVALFLASPNVLPPDAAIALYVSVGNSPWAFRGYISNAHPSEVMPLSWPDPPDSGVPGPGWAKIGVSVEPLAEVAARESAKVNSRETFAKRIGLDLFNYLQSFPGIPPDLRNALDKWFDRISRKFRLDPEFLNRQDAV